MIRKTWIEIRSSLWFVPAVLVVAAIVLSLSLVEVDLRYMDTLRYKSWQPLLNTGAEGARGMLSAIAGSMMTVVGVAFSVTIVTLSLASTQYTPRILRNFMRDRGNQFVLGMFVAIYTYCLIVLRSIRAGDDNGGFVPLIAIAVGMLLALISIGGLIFFIHHIAASIQASTILKEICQETATAIQRNFPHEIEDSEPSEPEEVDLPSCRDWFPIRAETDGYLQHVDVDALVNFAEKNETVLRIESRPGSFVAEGSVLGFTEEKIEDKEYGIMRSMFVIGDFRTVEQDVSFGIRQTVDIALKALSPGINDTSTAASCLDYLGAILCRITRHKIPDPRRMKDDKLRVIFEFDSFGEFLDRSFDEIRLSAAGNVTILLLMLKILERVAEATSWPSRTEDLLVVAGQTMEMADHSVSASFDRNRINEQLAKTRKSLDVSTAKLPLLATIRKVEAWG